MSARIIALMVIVAALIAGAVWMTNTNEGAMQMDEIRADMPNVEMGTGTATIPVPVDADIVEREGQIGDRTIEYPAVDVTTEDREIEYPTVEVTPAEDADDAQIEPVMEDPNDPVPPVDVDVDEDGDITATQQAE